MVCPMATARNQILPLRYRAVATLSGLVALLACVLPCFTDAAPARAATTCSPPVLDCTAGSISGGQVIIGRSTTTPGSPAKPATRTGGATIIVVPAPLHAPATLQLVCTISAIRPWYCPAPARPVTTPAVPARAPVTLSDIAAFVPQAVTLQSEPQGWALVGLPVNFVAGASSHVVSGRLLGSAANVRFTPIAFAWSYGEGTSVTTTSPGATWAALGLPAFSATATSHVYRALGSYRVSVTVSYSAAYQYVGSGWVAISGRLNRLAATTIEVVSGGVPLLVTQPCGRGSVGLGC